MWEFVDDAEFVLPAPEFVEFDKCKIAAYRLKLDAPSLLFVHGMGGSCALNGPFLNALARSFDVLSFDLPGHGASDLINDFSIDALSAVAAAVLKYFGIEKYYAMGHSMGCPIAARTSRHGECLGLIFSCPAGMYINFFKNIGYKLLTGARLSKYVYEQRKLVARTILSDMAKIKDERITELEREVLEQRYDTYMTAYLRIINQFGLDAHESLFERLTLPFALVLCEHDTLVNNRHTEQLLSGKSRMTVWLEYDHQVTMEVPKLLAHAVTKVWEALK